MNTGPTDPNLNTDSLSHIYNICIIYNISNIILVPTIEHPYLNIPGNNYSIDIITDPFHIDLGNYSNM